MLTSPVVNEPVKMAVAWALVGCLAGASWQPAGAQSQPSYDWGLPGGYPLPAVPSDNPMSAAKVELGRHLFYDVRLSGNSTQSCASCHRQDLAFTDGRSHSVGSTGQRTPRSSMSLVNVAYAASFSWANPQLTRLEDHMLVPMFGRHPVELGLDPGGRWLVPLQRDPTYRRLFPLAFPGEPEVLTEGHVTKAIASFVRAIVSVRSPYDRYAFGGDASAVSDAVKRGEALFHKEPHSCYWCHGGGFNFSGPLTTRLSAGRVEFHNTGLYNLAGALSYPRHDPGLYLVTKDARDIGKFKAPTLRNIGVTAPYMHDGSVATLEEAINHYAAGGRTIESGVNRGTGGANPNKSPFVRGFSLSAPQRRDLVAFLESLTDSEILRDSRFANPWPGAAPAAAK
jgi:cytochrome c peroxidase